MLLLPYLLAPLYRAGHPASTLMAWRWATGAPVLRQWIDLGAMSPSLPEPQILELIATCEALLIERVRIERILRDLGPSWKGTRHALNELAATLRENR